MLEIVADVHERASGVPEELERLGAHVVMRRLTRGDYVAGPETLVERKTVRDLYRTIVEGRFWRQMHGLREAGSRPILLVEGGSLWLDHRGLVQPAALRGLLLAAGDLGVRVIRSDSPVDSAAWLVRVAERRRASRLEDRPVYAQRPKRRSLIAPAERALSSAPGVSVVAARRLLAHFGSVEAIARATLSELTAVPSIGKARATAIHRLIHDEWPDRGAH